MSITAPVVDTAGALKTHLRSLSAISDLVGQRVFFGIPPVTDWPLISLPFEDLRPDNTGTPTQSDLIQIDCWGSPHPTPGKTNKAEAKAVCLAVCTALRSLQSGTYLDDDVVALGASILSTPWAPDPDSNQARYSITVEVFAKPA